jgi:hypothetical protein
MVEHRNNIDSRTLLDPQFFVALASATDAEFTMQHRIAPNRHRALQSEGKLPELFLVTRDYKVWSAFVSRVVAGVRPLSNPSGFRSFVHAQTSVRLSPGHVRETFPFSEPTFSPEVGARIERSLESPLHTIDNLGDYEACYNCCYENTPRGCRQKINDDPGECFRMCIHSKLAPG